MVFTPDLAANLSLPPELANTFKIAVYADKFTSIPGKLPDLGHKLEIKQELGVNGKTCFPYGVEFVRQMVVLAE